MIGRIMHHVHTSAGLNKNQYGFTPERGTNGRREGSQGDHGRKLETKEQHASC